MDNATEATEATEAAETRVVLEQQHGMACNPALAKHDAPAIGLKYNRESA